MTAPAGSHVIRVDHLSRHPPTAVWKALTDPALHARWWAAGEVRPIVGHRFELDMGRWGKQPCEVLQVQHERLLKYRFAAGVLDTIITWHLTAEGSGTRLTLTHEGFNLDSPLSRQAFEGMNPRVAPGAGANRPCARRGQRPARLIGTAGGAVAFNLAPRLRRDRGIRVNLRPRNSLPAVWRPPADRPDRRGRTRGTQSSAAA
jgi:uncharacterized protein YndB with AHSA1/START domain